MMTRTTTLHEEFYDRNGNNMPHFISSLRLREEGFVVVIEVRANNIHYRIDMYVLVLLPWGYYCR